MATTKIKNSQEMNKSPLITKFLTRMNNKDRPVASKKRLVERKTFSVLQPSVKVNQQLARPGGDKENNAVTRKKKRKIGDVDGEENQVQGHSKVKSPRIDSSAKGFKIYVEQENKDARPTPKKAKKSRAVAETSSQTEITSFFTPADCTCACHVTGATPGGQTGQPEVDKNKPEVKERTAEEEAHDLMVKEDIPEEYWKDVAEERRKALEESLIENEELHEKVKVLEEENTQLTEMAGQAEYFASMLKTLTEEDKEPGGEEGESSATPNKDSSEDTCKESAEDKSE